jgi:hypothetical protein
MDSLWTPMDPLLTPYGLLMDSYGPPIDSLWAPDGPPMAPSLSRTHTNIKEGHDRLSHTNIKEGVQQAEPSALDLFDPLAAVGPYDPQWTLNGPSIRTL